MNWLWLLLFGFCSYPKKPKGDGHFLNQDLLQNLQKTQQNSSKYKPLSTSSGNTVHTNTCIHVSITCTCTCIIIGTCMQNLYSPRPAIFTELCVNVYNGLCYIWSHWLAHDQIARSTIACNNLVDLITLSMLTHWSTGPREIPLTGLG